MADYQINHASRTLGSIMVANILTLGTAQAGPPAAFTSGSVANTLLNRSYISSAQMPSYDQYMVVIGSKLEQGQDKFVQTVSDFYADLLAKQEPLGHEFSKILYENLWDLYES